MTQENLSISEGADSWPKVSRALVHDFSNKFQSELYRGSCSGESGRSDFHESGCDSNPEDAVKAYSEFMRGLEDDNRLKRDDAYNRMKNIADSDVPGYVEDLMDEAVHFFDAAEAYKNIKEGRVSEIKMDLDYLLKPFYRDDNIEVDTEDFDKTLKIEGSAALLFPFTTIIKNEYDHAGLEGKKEECASQVWVEAYREQDDVVVEIYDDGPGLEPEQSWEDLTKYGNGDQSGMGLGFATDMLDYFGGDIEYFEPETEGMGHRATLPLSM